MLDVLIVGAGPTGLTAGCLLARRGVSVRIVRKHRPFTGHSRASVIWPRALEILDSIGVVETLESTGNRVGRLGYYSSGSPIARFELDRLTDTRFGYALGVSQHKTEAALEAAFLAAGGEIGDGEVTELEQDERQVSVRVRAGERHSTIRARHLIGADGANSVVRARLGIAMNDVGPTLSFRITDALISGLPQDEAAYCWTPQGGMAIGPHDHGEYRLACRLTPDSPDASRESFQRLLDTRGPNTSRGVVRELVSTADFDARFAIAERFSAGRCHLAGDAAHVMAPTGGQGMNAGILDAGALATRIEDACKGGAPEDPLSGYDAERQSAIRKIIATAVEHARDGGLRSETDIADRDRRYRDMWNDPARHLDRVTRISQLHVDPGRVVLERSRS